MVEEPQMTVVEVVVSVSPGGDVGLSAHERHQLILSPDEQFLGVALLYDGSPPADNILTS